MEKQPVKMLYMPNVSEIYDFAYLSLQSLPKNFRNYLKNFIVDVQNFANQATLNELSIENKYDLLGLYKGVPVPLKNKVNSKEPDRIYLFRCPLIRHSFENGENVQSLINHVLINEIGHHLGCTPNEMADMYRKIKYSIEN